jgi:AcrR family transcriptional regulator
MMKAKPKTQKRDLILDMALKLFNEQGSHRVTTNHVAKAMGISPGNLYYHFENKEHIIRELLIRLIKGFDALVNIQAEVKSVPDFIAETVASTSRLIFTYRFIYIELAALLIRDKKFKAMYHDTKARRAREFVLFFDFVSQMGVIRQDITPQERDAMIFIIWTYAEGIITSLHTSNIPVTSSAIQSHFKKILYILKTYLKPDLWTALIQKLDL